MNQRQLALANAAAGWKVFPCLPEDSGKRKAKAPLLKGERWPELATTDPSKIEFWWEEWEDALVGIAVPEGVTVIDVDHHDDRDGLALAEANGWPVEAQVMGTSTSGNGRHLWYAGSSRNVPVVPRYIDRKTVGGYVVTPYVVPPLNKITEPLPPAYWMTETTPVESATSAEVQAWLDQHDETPSDVILAELQAVQSLGELHGDEELSKRIRYIVKLAEVGYPGATQALDGIRAVWDATDHASPSPTWFDRTLAYAIAAEHVTKVEPVSKSGQTGQLDALMGRDFPELDWVVPGIVPEGVTLLSAAPKIGKSWMTLDLAMASATGGLAFGAVPVGAKRPVLYVDLESGERRLQSRILIQAHDWRQADSFRYHTDAATAGDVIRAFFASHRGQRPLVVLDMLAGILGPKPANLTQYQHDRSILDPLHAIVSDDPGAALIIVHHTRKTESADPMDLISGTNGFSGAVDTPAILTRPDRSQPIGSLFVMGRDMDGDIEFQVSLSKRARWELVGGSPKAAAQNAAHASEQARVAKLGGDKQTVLTLVNSFAPADVKIADVEQSYKGEHPERVRKYLSELARDALILRVANGVYRARGADGVLGPDAIPF